MHLHLPKPLHGWREFVGEVGIIVVGVLIALTFEAIVEDLTWRSKVTEARAELRFEVGHDLAILHDRASEQECVDRRLDELRTIITRSTESGRLPPVGNIGSADHYTWSSSVWDSQVAAQTITHFPADQTAAISRVYRIIATVSEINADEKRDWLTLETMVGPGRPVDPSSLSQLISALDAARAANREFRYEEDVIGLILVNGGLGKDFPQVDAKNPPWLTGHWSICKPIGTQAPTRY